jgi:hypothetical protein
MKTPTITQLRAGPPSVDLLTAAAVLGLGRTKAYELARRGEFPVRILRDRRLLPRPHRRAARSARHQRDHPRAG